MIPTIQGLVEEAMYVSQGGITIYGGDAYCRLDIFMETYLTLWSVQTIGSSYYPQKILPEKIQPQRMVVV